jgi:Cysteine-rich secretory protein family
MRIALALSCLLLTAPAIAQEADVIEDVWTDTTPQPRGDALLRAAMLADHNRVRRDFGVPALAWDDALAAEAAAYARTLAAANRFEHSRRVPGARIEGENLWMGTHSAFAYTEMTGSWIEEGADYRDGAFPNVSRTGSWHDVGHFTQMIWGGTQAVGCGLAGNRDYEYLVCRYFPAGNVMGERVASR